jgi:hypothetical protein
MAMWRRSVRRVLVTGSAALSLLLGIVVLAEPANASPWMQLTSAPAYSGDFSVEAWVMPPRPPATEISVTRRGAAVAGKLPVRSLRRSISGPKRLKSGAPSCGLQTCEASAREYEIGGWSNQSASARHADLTARPPPTCAGAQA